MTERIEIHDLLIRGIIGINDDERVNLQDVVIDLTLETDLRAAGESDDIEDAVNYRTIVKDVIDLVENAKFFLVERLAARIAEVCLSDERVDRAIVSVRKPGAIRFARTVGVTIERSRDDVR
jgi:D-erythro-7,8-dihydroneopterin triphosphate epimerase